MIPAFSTDVAGRLDLYFRVNANNVPISLTFLDSDGQAYSFIYDEFQLLIKDHIGSRKNRILLGLGSGLTLNANVLTFQITQALSKVKPGEYYWELYKNDYGRPWINGLAYAIDGITPAIQETTEVTINEGGYNVSVTINEAGGNGTGASELDGGSSATIYLGANQELDGGSSGSNF